MGELPPSIRTFPQQHATVNRLTVEGELTNSRERIHQAVKQDPLTAAALTLDEIESMTGELIAANESYLPTLN